MDQKKLTAAEILAIKNSYDLFRIGVNHKNAAHGILRELQAIWHPDRNRDPKAGDVMAHINALYQKFQSGDLGQVLQFDMPSPSKKSYCFKYKVLKDLGVSCVYIGNKMVLYQYNNDNVDLFDLAIKNISSVKLPPKMIESGFNRMIPRELVIHKDTNKGNIFTIYKSKNQFSLEDLLNTGYTVEPEHLVWILKGIYIFALLMNKSQGKVFGGLSLDGIYVNPLFKTIHVLGGWEFATPINSKLIALPEWVINQIPDRYLKDEKAITKIDQISIKSLGICLLGDKTMVGSKLLTLGKKYQPIVSFLRSNSNGDLLEDYGQWMKLVKDFSKKDLQVTTSDIYK